MKLYSLIAAFVLIIGTCLAQDKDESNTISGTDGILTRLFTPEVISGGVKGLFDVIELKIRLAALVRRMLTPENLRENLSLLRKVLNFTMRLSKFVLTYLPTPEPNRDFLQQVFPQVDLQQNEVKIEEEAPEMITQTPLIISDDITDPNIDQKALEKLIFGEPPTENSRK